MNQVLPGAEEGPARPRDGPLRGQHAAELVAAAVRGQPPRPPGRRRVNHCSLDLLRVYFFGLFEEMSICTVLHVPPILPNADISMSSHFTNINK